MKASVRILSALLPAILWAAMPVAAEDEPADEAAPIVEVCFVLDTTGSMGGLIEGAKAKIWSLANQILRGEPTPEVRMGLVAYRDRRDDYVTRVFDLTDDIDAVYKNLKSFEASGGGDGPEDVQQALTDAIHKMQWTKGEEPLKIIFLVGDAPPHTDYDNSTPYRESAKQAIENGIYINTIRCGSDVSTGQAWQEIARAAEGMFVSIDQGGGVVEIATPMDEDLAALNRKLSDTFVAYGGAELRRRAEAKAKDAGAMEDVEDAAERAEYAGRSGAVVAGEEGEADLVEASSEGRADLDKIAEEELPDEMKGMSPEERKAYIEKKTADRQALRAQIAALAAKRDAYIQKVLADQDGGQDGFDQQVLRALREQAAKKGIRYE